MFTQSGVMWEKGVTQNAKVMLVTSLLYFVIQIPAFKFDDGLTKEKASETYGGTEGYVHRLEYEGSSEKIWALAGGILCAIFFMIYLYLQYVASRPEPAAAETKAPANPYLQHLMPAPVADRTNLLQERGVVQYIEDHRQTLLKIKQGVGMPYPEALKIRNTTPVLPTVLLTALDSVFTKYMSKDDKIFQDDMKRALASLGLKYKQEKFQRMFAKADADQSAYLDRKEFISFFTDIVSNTEDPMPYEEQKSDPSKQAPKTDSGGEEEDEDDDEEEMPEEFKDLPADQQRSAILHESVKSMLLGTVLVLIFSDPMVDVLAKLGKMTGVPAFYVSFVLSPLASNASELISSYKLASKKTSNSITASLQTLEGAACMNNTFCLGIFFALIYAQGLAWKYTAETCVIFLVQLLIFFVVMKNANHSVLMGCIVFMCYPLSLAFVYVLENIFHLD
jgi:Ca2+/Na+ antiporter